LKPRDEDFYGFSARNALRKRRLFYLLGLDPLSALPSKIELKALSHIQVARIKQYAEICDFYLQE